MVQPMWNLYILWISFLYVVSANCQEHTIFKEFTQEKTPNVIPVLKFNLSSLKTAILNLNATSNKNIDSTTNETVRCHSDDFNVRHCITALSFSTLFRSYSSEYREATPHSSITPPPDFQRNDSIVTVMNKFPFILPGTKWCGIGDVAENDTDLGIFSDTDACCRTHDKCSNYISPEKTKYEIFNSEIFPVFDCNCEIEFYKCLSNVNTFPSLATAYAYFQLKEKCIIYDHPRTCLSEEKLSNTTQLNATEPNTIQFNTTQLNATKLNTKQSDTVEISKRKSDTGKCKAYQLDESKTPLWQMVEFETDLPKIKFDMPLVGTYEYSSRSRPKTKFTSSWSLLEFEEIINL